MEIVIWGFIYLAQIVSFGLLVFVLYAMVKGE